MSYQTSQTPDFQHRNEWANQIFLKDLYDNVKPFGFIAGYQKQIIKAQGPIIIKATEYIGKLHDAPKAVGYTGHEFEVYYVR